MPELARRSSRAEKATVESARLVRALTCWGSKSCARLVLACARRSQQEQPHTHHGSLLLSHRVARRARYRRTADCGACTYVREDGQAVPALVLLISGSQAAVARPPAIIGGNDSLAPFPA